MTAANQIVRISVQARDFWCEGDIIVPTPSGYKGRVLDLLNGSAEFLALTDVLLLRDTEATTEATDDGPVPHDVLLLRKAEIQYVIPLD